MTSLPHRDAPTADAFPLPIVGKPPRCAHRHSPIAPDDWSGAGQTAVRPLGTCLSTSLGRLRFPAFPPGRGELHLGVAEWLLARNAANAASRARTDNSALMNGQVGGKANARARGRGGHRVRAANCGFAGRTGRGHALPVMRDRVSAPGNRSGRAPAPAITAPPAPHSQHAASAPPRRSAPTWTRRGPRTRGCARAAMVVSGWMPSRGSGEPDHAVVESLPAVDDAGASAVGV